MTLLRWQCWRRRTRFFAATFGILVSSSPALAQDGTAPPAALGEAESAEQLIAQADALLAAGRAADAEPVARAGRAPRPKPSMAPITGRWCAPPTAWA